MYVQMYFDTLVLCTLESHCEGSLGGIITVSKKCFTVNSGT